MVVTKLPKDHPPSPKFSSTLFLCCYGEEDNFTYLLAENSNVIDLRETDPFKLRKTVENLCSKTQPNYTVMDDIQTTDISSLSLDTEINRPEYTEWYSVLRSFYHTYNIIIISHGEYDGLDYLSLNFSFSTFACTRTFLDETKDQNLQPTAKWVVKTIRNTEGNRSHDCKIIENI